VTAKDLTSFAKQMENVANQIKDGATAGRLTSLVAKTRRLISTNILPLETRRVCEPLLFVSGIFSQLFLFVDYYRNFHLFDDFCD